jgi:hypothetical protein
MGDPHGRLMWVSPTLPGSVHDLKAARTHGIIAALTRAAVATFADKGYRGARGAVAVLLDRTLVVDDEHGYMREPFAELISVQAGST